MVWWIIAACLNVSAAIVYARHSKPGLAVLWIVIAAFCASLAVCLLKKEPAAMNRLSVPNKRWSQQPGTLVFECSSCMVASLVFAAVAQLGCWAACRKFA